ncbi:MAG: hypothetical protein AAGE52_21945 [Myxococcota bacterium]
MKLRLEHHQGKKRKFWQIEVEGDTRTVTQGATKAKKPPTPKTKQFKSADAATANFHKEVDKKRAAGFFDPTSLESILAAHDLAPPDDAEVDAHRQACPHLSDEYLEVFKTGILNIDLRGDFGDPEEKFPGAYPDLASFAAAHSADDYIGDTALDATFYVVGELFDGAALVLINQGSRRNTVGLIENLDDSLLDHVTGDADATIEALLDEGLLELTEQSFATFVHERVLHHKGAAVEKQIALAQALQAVQEKVGENAESIETLDLSELGLQALPEALAACVHLHTLDLHKNELKDVPPVLRTLKKLAHLNLDSNRTGWKKKLPDWIAELPLLTFSYRYNMGEGFPKPVASMPTLRTLRLSGVDIVPPEIGALTKLEVLEIGGVEGAIDDALGSCSSLRELRLGRTQASLATIGKLQELEVLEADHFNRKVELTWPEGLGTLAKLRRLQLGSAKLPHNLAGLSSLEELVTSPDALPDGVCELASLKRLDLHYARIETLPENFGKLKNLEWLKLESSYVKSLPASFSTLPKLEWLNLATAADDLHIGSALAGLESLRFLALYFHALKTIEGSLATLKNLEELRIFREPAEDEDWKARLSFLTELPQLRRLMINHKLEPHVATLRPDVELT